MCGKAFIKSATKALSSAGIKYEVLEDDRIAVKFSSEKSRNHSYVLFIVNQDNNVLFLTTVLSNIAESQRDRVLRIVTKRNYELIHGSFDFCMDSGDLRFRSAIYSDNLKKLDADEVLRNTLLGIRMYDGIMPDVEPSFEN